jgi:hypothetical protein
MQASTLYFTIPVRGSFVIAETGHAETHDGSTQLKHYIFVNAKPSTTWSFRVASPRRYALITLRVLPEMSIG